MKVGVLVGGETSVRAAHSLSADPGVDELVVLGPAKSQNFKVVSSPAGLDVLVGSGPRAPVEARKHGLPLIWDGTEQTEGVHTWGASVIGLTAAISKRHRSPEVIAVAHPNLPAGTGPSVRFARPVGATQTNELVADRTSMFAGKSYNDYAACLVTTKRRRFTVVDRADFLSGIALAAGIAAFGKEPQAVWASALKYLETAAGMGMVMAAHNV